MPHLKIAIMETPSRIQEPYFAFPLLLLSVSKSGTVAVRRTAFDREQWPLAGVERIRERQALCYFGIL